MEIYRRIGERIRHARSKAGLTQPQLAEILKVSKGIISRWETGLARPSLDRLEPLARRLGISLETLLGFAPVEGSGAFRARAVPAWELSGSERPDFSPTTSIGEVLVSEEEALLVQAAVLIRDNCFCPHFQPGDVVGLQTTGRAKLGDVIFVRKERRIILRCYGGKRKVEMLLPMAPLQTVETVPRLELLGVCRWMHRPGKIVSPR